MNEQPVLDVTFTYDYETYKRFLYFNMGINKTLMILMIPILFVSLLTGFILDRPYSNIIFFLVALSVALFPLITFVLPSALYKKAKDMMEVNQRLIFYENYLYGESASLILNQNGTYSYDLFNRICETGDAFYLYLKSGQAYIVAKKYLNEQQMIILHNFLRYRFGAQYKYTK